MNPHNVYNNIMNNHDKFILQLCIDTDTENSAENFQ